MSKQVTADFKAPDFRLGYNAGYREALMAASQLIRRMAKERGRSDVNAIKAACAILEMDDAGR